MASSQPIATPAERVSAKPAGSKIDAFVPPIRRQRPVTPPLTFSEPSSAKSAKGPAPKAVKAQVKRASRKGPEPARSALGAASPGKVASEAATASKSKP